MNFSLHTLPIELVYCILDNLDEKSVCLSIRNVCQRLDIIVDTYRPYQVSFHFNFYVNMSSFSDVFSIEEILILSGYFHRQSLHLVL